MYTPWILRYTPFEILAFDCFRRGNAKGNRGERCHPIGVHGLSGHSDGVLVIVDQYLFNHVSATIPTQSAEKQPKESVNGSRLMKCVLRKYFSRCDGICFDLIAKDIKSCTRWYRRTVLPSFHLKRFFILPKTKTKLEGWRFNRVEKI